MRYHLLSECTKIKLRCTVCSLNASRLALGEHDCVPGLKMLVEEQKQWLGLKDEQIDKYKHTMNLLESEIAEKDALIS